METERELILKVLRSIAITNHPHSNAITRNTTNEERRKWGLQRGKVCNLCDRYIRGSGWTQYWKRTKQSIEAEEKHIGMHIEEYRKVYIPIQNPELRLVISDW